MKEKDFANRHAALPVKRLRGWGRRVPSSGFDPCEQCIHMYTVERSQTKKKGPLQLKNLEKSLINGRTRSTINYAFILRKIDELENNFL